MTKRCDEGEVMVKGRCVIPIMFRAYKHGQFKGDVDAVFPTVMADCEGKFITVYAHVGQHSGGDYGTVLKQTRTATPKEYTPLLKELRKIGYRNLKIYKRVNYDWISEARRDMRMKCR